MSVIAVRGLKKTFQERIAVRDVSLMVERGEIFGFLGANGSGKTTTLRLLCGLLTPDAGSGHCLGFDILRDAAQIKTQVGYMTQRFSYYEDLSVEENLQFVAALYELTDPKRCVQETLAELGLRDRKDQLTGELSGGWKQRVALAASLMHDPQLLLLDEPTAGVDPKARREFWDHIHQLRERGITTLVSTHYMDEAERCTRLAYLSQGQVMVTGTVETVIQQAKLSVWHVTGDALTDLAAALRTVPSIQVIAFGQSLHISSREADSLAQVLKPYQQDTRWQWQRMPASLEDAFISYVSNETEGQEK